MLSFDITDRNIRIIKGTESGGKIRISSAATLNLEEEVIVNGHVRDVPRLATLINQVLRTNKMPDKEAIVSISSNMTIFKEVHIQKAEKQQDFMKMVRAEMQTALGIDESYSISYIIVGDSDQLQGGVKVLATACPFEVVDCYKRVFNMLQISLRSVMIGCNCITKVLLADTKVKQKMPLLAVQIDNNFISLNLYEDNQLSFSRFASISSEDYDDSPDYVFEAVNENIFRMLQFQKSKAGSAPIENVVFYGDTREYVRLTNELEKMGIRTSIISVPPQIHGYENLEFSSYANAIGAMFKRNKDTERINLLETDTVNNNRIKSNSSYYVLLLGSIAASLLIVGAAWAVLAIQDKVVKNETKEIKEKNESKLCADLKAQLVDLDNKQNQMNSYLGGVQLAYDEYASRPYPLSKNYDLIEDTIHEVITDAWKEEIEADEELKDKKRTEADFSEYYMIDNINYSEGVYTLNVTFQGKVDEPFQSLPSALIAKFRSLKEVYSLPYAGYAPVYTQITDDQKQAQQTAPTQPAEGEGEGEGETEATTPTVTPTTTENENNEKVTITLALQIMMKGDAVSLAEEE